MTRCVSQIIKPGSSFEASNDISPTCSGRFDATGRGCWEYTVRLTVKKAKARRPVLASKEFFIQEQFAGLVSARDERVLVLVAPAITDYFTRLISSFPVSSNSIITFL